MSNGTQLISRETLLSHLQRAEGAEEVSLPIDFFRDLLYQAMPQQRKPLNGKQINQLIKDAGYGDEQNEAISNFVNGIAFAEDAHGIKADA